MSDFQVQETNNIYQMKNSMKTFLALFMASLFFISCKKDNQIQPPEPIVLKNNTDFRQFVAADILSRIQFTHYVSGKLNAGTYAGVKAGMAVATEATLPAVFNKYQLDYQFFQQHTVERLSKTINVLHQFPAMAQLPEAEINRLLQIGYQQVADELSLKIEAKLKQHTQPGRGIKPMTASPEAQNKLLTSGINTGMKIKKNNYFTDYIDEIVPEEELVNQIAADIDMIETYGAFTPGEVWKCLKEALGFGAGSIVSFAGWSRLSAGLPLQEIIGVVSRWAIRHAGWIGAAVIVIDFGDCMYNSLSR